jgi:hypothetical protein
LLPEALKLDVDDARRYDDCIPSVEEANSAATKVMFTTVVQHGRQATAADIILYDSKEKMLHYLATRPD